MKNKILSNMFLKTNSFVIMRFAFFAFCSFLLLTTDTAVPLSKTYLINSADAKKIRNKNSITHSLKMTSNVNNMQSQMVFKDGTDRLVSKGQYENVENNFFMDSICFYEGKFEFCYTIDTSYNYFLVIKSGHFLIDSVRLSPFVWRIAGNERIFSTGSKIKNNIIEFSSDLLLLAAPMDEGSAVLIPIKRTADKLMIEKRRSRWMEDDFGFIYDVKDKIFISAINRGDDFGQVELRTYSEGRPKFLRKVKTNNDFSFPPTKEYLEEVINIINY